MSAEHNPADYPRSWKLPYLRALCQERGVEYRIEDDRGKLVKLLNITNPEDAGIMERLTPVTSLSDQVAELTKNLFGPENRCGVVQLQASLIKTAIHTAPDHCVVHLQFPHEVYNTVLNLIVVHKDSYNLKFVYEFDEANLAQAILFRIRRRTMQELYSIFFYRGSYKRAPSMFVFKRWYEIVK